MAEPFFDRTLDFATVGALFPIKKERCYLMYVNIHVNECIYAYHVCYCHTMFYVNKYIYIERERDTHREKEREILCMFMYV